MNKTITIEKEVKILGGYVEQLFASKIEGRGVINITQYNTKFKGFRLRKEVIFPLDGLDKVTKYIIDTKVDVVNNNKLETVNCKCKEESTFEISEETYESTKAIFLDIMKDKLVYDDIKQRSEFYFMNAIVSLDKWNSIVKFPYIEVELVDDSFTIREVLDTLFTKEELDTVLISNYSTKKLIKFQSQLANAITDIDKKEIDKALENIIEIHVLNLNHIRLKHYNLV